MSKKRKPWILVFSGMTRPASSRAAVRRRGDPPANALERIGSAWMAGNPVWAQFEVGNLAPTSRWLDCFVGYASSQGPLLGTICTFRFLREMGFLALLHVPQHGFVFFAHAISGLALPLVCPLIRLLIAVNCSNVIKSFGLIL